MKVILDSPDYRAVYRLKSKSLAAALNRAAILAEALSDQEIVLEHEVTFRGKHKIYVSVI